MHNIQIPLDFIIKHYKKNPYIRPTFRDELLILSLKIYILGQNNNLVLNFVLYYEGIKVGP